jgi:hypothetical protein
MTTATQLAFSSCLKPTIGTIALPTLTARPSILSRHTMFPPKVDQQQRKEQ